MPFYQEFFIFKIEKLHLCMYIPAVFMNDCKILICLFDEINIIIIINYYNYTIRKVSKDYY